MSSNTLSWDKLFLTGSVVSLSTSLWRARVQIKADDLGIDDTVAVQTALSLGCHRLAPPRAFEAILEPARAAARAIDYYSLNFGLIKGARYVPEKNIPALEAELKANKEKFKLAVDEFMQNYEKTKEEMLPIIEQALVDAANNPQCAVSAFERIKAEYPTANEVKDRFDLSWSVYAIKSAKTENIADAAAQEAEGVKSIIGDMVKQLRGDLTEKLKAILEITTRGGKLSDKSLISAKQLLDRVDSLNVLGDETLSQQIKAMRKALSTVSEGQYDDGFVVGLNDIQKNLQESVEQAIKDAEENLTGVGRRKLTIVPQPAAQQEVPEQFDLGSL